MAPRRLFRPERGAIIDAMAKRKPVFWFSFRTDRRRIWTVWFTTPEMWPGLGVNDDGEEDYADVVFPAQRIYLNARKPRKTFEPTVLHEMGHVTLEDTALAYKETFIECHAVHQLPILKSLGFRFPPVPRAAFLLRRAA